MFVIAIVEKGKFSNSWEYMQGRDGDTKRFKTKEEASDYILENSIDGVVIEI